MQKLRNIKDADVAGKRVLVRCDFDVPIEDGKVVDDTRLRGAVPTLDFLRGAGAAKLVLMGHVGRPGGQIVEGLRVAPIVARLGELTDMQNVEVQENLRFNPGEEANDHAFAAELAALGDVYVNESFANSHRTHASMVGVPRLLPSFAGLQLQREVEELSHALTPPKGALAIIGGAKFETKQPLLEKLLLHYDEILVGGAIANDLLKARGTDVGMSLVSKLPVPVELAEDVRLLVPTDTVESAGRIVDIGAGTASAWSAKVAAVPFVLWNGPMGIYEDGFVQGTDALASALASSSARAVVGGGDTIAALAKSAFNSKNIFISTGGGAMLQFLAEGTLPALEVLEG